MRAHRRLAQILVVVSFIYPALVLSVVIALRWVGERWWITGVGLYFPRLLLAAPLPFLAVLLAIMGLSRYLWTQIAAALLCAFPLMGLTVHWRTPPRTGGPIIRVLTYNINANVGGIDHVVDEIARFSPDVVLLQETGLVDALVAKLQTVYPTVNAENQFLVASRYPVLSTVSPDRLDYDGRLRSPRFVQQTLQTPLGRIVIYNIHPISPRESFYELRGFRRGLLSGRLLTFTGSALYKANSGLRTLQVQAFSEAAKRETDPVIIAGDTNLPGLSYVFDRFLSGYQDGFAEAGSGFGYTYPTNRHPWMRIDRILASQELRFVRFEVGSSLASDHLCVVADLERRGQ